MIFFKRLMAGILLLGSFASNVDAMNINLTNHLIKGPMTFKAQEFNESPYCTLLYKAVEESNFDDVKKILAAAFTGLSCPSFEAVLCYRGETGNGELSFEKAYSQENLGILMIICSYVMRSTIQTGKFNKELQSTMTDAILSAVQDAGESSQAQVYDCVCMEDVIQVAVETENQAMQDNVFTFFLNLALRYSDLTKNANKVAAFFVLMNKHVSPEKCVQLFDIQVRNNTSFAVAAKTRSLQSSLQSIVIGYSFEFCYHALYGAIKNRKNTQDIVNATKRLLLEANRLLGIDSAGQLFSAKCPLNALRELAQEKGNKEICKALSKEKPFCSFK